MNQTNFKELYKLYQSTLVETFEDAIKDMGWKVTKRIYKSSYSKDVATLEIRIRYKEDKDEGSFFFGNSWKEILFIDRDDISPRIDMGVLDKNFGLEKTIRIATEKAEALDAFSRNDLEKIHALGKMMGRIKAPVPIDPQDQSKGSILIHYENGIEQPDSGSIIRKEDNHE